jgi:hypothetical protein
VTGFGYYAATRTAQTMMTHDDHDCSNPSLFRGDGSAGLAQILEKEMPKPQGGGSISLASSWITIYRPSDLHLLSDRIGAIPWGA